MAIARSEFDRAEKCLATRREAGHAVAARYDRRTSRIVVTLGAGVELAFPARLAEGLAEASPEDPAEIEIRSTGLGLHWPKLDADVYAPALLQGIFGSRNWTARELGASGGRKGGRPRKTAA